MALCDALTHCHVGYEQGKAELKNIFDWELGQEISSETLIEMADYLEKQWALKGRRDST